MSAISLLTSLALGFPNTFERAAPITHPYYPLHVGSEWTYRVQGGEIKVLVASVRKVGEIDGFVLETSAQGKVGATEAVGVTKDGVFRFGVNDQRLDYPIMLIRSNPNVGDKWTIDSRIVLREDERRSHQERIRVIQKEVPLTEAQIRELEALSTELVEGRQPVKGEFTTGAAKVTVPFGTFDTVHVKSAAMLVGGAACMTESWYAKDIGLVKLKFGSGGIDSQMELQNYKRGK